MHRRSSRSFLLSIAATGLLAFTASCPTHAADDAPQPSTLLQQLSNDTQKVYEHVRGGMIWVQLPTPQWLEQINDQEQLLRKFGAQLDPAVRDMIRREQEQIRSQAYRPVGAVTTTQLSVIASTQVGPSTQPTVGGGELMFPGRLLPDAGKWVYVATGLIIDNDGHAIVPAFIDGRSLPPQPMRVMTGNGKVASAKFIGADRKTNLTVIQLDQRDIQPVALAPHRPENGALTIVFDREGFAHLTIWANLHPDTGVIVNPDGAVAGFGFNGQFLTAAACKPIVQQLIATGDVRRAILGVRVARITGVNGNPALRVLEIDADSPAQRGGLRVGDLILTLAGEPVGDAPTFAAVIAMSNGRTVFQVLRGTDTVEVTVDLQPK